MAVVKRLRDRHAEAVELYREAVDSADLILGSAHPQTLMVRGNFATTLAEAGRFEEALGVYERAVDASREEWPEGHWRTAGQLMQMGGTLIRAGQPEKAIVPLSEAVDEATQQIGARHSWTNVYRAWLGVAAVLTGRDAAAEQLFGWSLEGLGSYDGLAEDRVVLSMIEALVDEMRAQGLDEEAAPYAALIEGASGGP